MWRGGLPTKAGYLTYLVSLRLLSAVQQSLGPVYMEVGDPR